MNKSIKDDVKTMLEEFIKKKRGRKNKDNDDIINGENNSIQKIRRIIK